MITESTNKILSSDVRQQILEEDGHHKRIPASAPLARPVAANISNAHALPGKRLDEEPLAAVLIYSYDNGSL